MDLKIPFVRSYYFTITLKWTHMRVMQIFSHGSPFASIPDEFMQKVQDYGLGIVSRWSPQQLILMHEVGLINLSLCLELTLRISYRLQVGLSRIAAITV